MSTSTHGNVESDGRTRRSRLSELLTQRDGIGTRWAESISHALPAASVLTIDLMVVEAALSDGWPDLADRWIGEWAIADIRKLHDPDMGLRAGCTICAQRSTAHSA